MNVPVPRSAAGSGAPRGDFDMKTSHGPVGRRRRACKMRKNWFAYSLTAMLALLGIATASKSAGDGDGLSRGLIAHWKMDEAEWAGAGAVKDSSGNGHHGTASGATPTSQAKFGGGASFTNESDCISIGAPLAGTNITFSLWYCYKGPNPGKDFNVLLACGEGNFFHLVVYKTGEIGTYGGIWLRSGTFLDRDRWYHLVKVIEGTRHTLYVNGTIEHDFDSFRNSERPFSVIGNSSMSKSGVRYYGAGGIIDEVRVWDRPLSSAEAVALFKEGK